MVKRLEYGLFVLLALISSLISAVFGLGTALFVIAIGSYLLPVKEAIALATILFTAGTSIRTIVYWKHIDWRLTLVMTVFSVPCAYLGASLLAVTPTDLLKKLLGSMALFYVATSFFGWTPKIHIGRLGIAVGSASYGFVSGLLGTGNIIKAMIFDHMGFRKEAFVGVMAATSVLANFAKVASYARNGLITEDHMLTSVGLIVSIVTVTVAGRNLLQRVSAEHFRYGMLSILTIVAVGLFF